MYDDDDFVALWETLRAELPERAAAAFITATLPPRVRDEIKRQFPLVEERLGKGLHRTYAGVRERLVDCSSAEGGDGLALKTSALLRELALCPREARRSPWFCTRRAGKLHSARSPLYRRLR